MSWTVIATISEWKSFLISAVNAYGDHVRGTKGPDEYPALAQVKKDSITGRVTFNYVYVDQAQELIDAVSPKPRRVVSSTASASQDEFNSHMFAMGMALSYFVIETGIAKKKQFEEKLQEFRDIYREEKAKGNKHLLEGNRCPWSQE